MIYLNPEHPDAFVDFPDKKTIPSDHHECLKCKGHGGWNLKLNAYPLREEDTPENRHLFSHFRASCFNCHGYGYTKDVCNHEWSDETTIGRCLHSYTCILCGKIKLVDSGD
jgi:hypothetical protein